MKRYALIFLAAVFLPSLVLGWLALRTAGEQRVLLERQATDLHQAETDAIAARVAKAVSDKQQLFASAVRKLVAEHGASALAENYGKLLDTAWSGGGVPFALSPQGRIAFPSPTQARNQTKEDRFLTSNAAFLNNESRVELYQVPPSVPEKKSSVSKSKTGLPARESYWSRPEARSQTQISRNISPQKSEIAADSAQQLSRVAPEYSNFQGAVGASPEGSLARFVDDELQVLFWTRPDPAANWLFGLKLGSEELDALAASALTSLREYDIEVAILNDKARPVARVPADFEAVWKRPFVATEIGETLPHWEVALYLSDPDKFATSAMLITLTLGLLIALALAAILAGGFFVALDTRRQLALAQKKTDFVSNVSHELKTPLTSIRMFAELLSEDRVKEPEKQRRYLRIIAGESERLARLVSNVLDFARLEKHEKIYAKSDTDIHPVIERVWEAESLRLKGAGFSADWSADAGTYMAHCDTDAVAQVLLNLISNAEKYSAERREIELQTRAVSGMLNISVLDRGIGVSSKLAEKIFEAFFRADDSLASHVQGSGLGLTLARRIARDHGGDITHQPREGGGSIFTFRIPLTQVS